MERLGLEVIKAQKHALKLMMGGHGSLVLAKNESKWETHIAVSVSLLSLIFESPKHHV